MEQMTKSERYGKYEKTDEKRTSKLYSDAYYGNQPFIHIG